MAAGACVWRAVAEGVFCPLGPLNISREPANDVDTRRKDADGGNIYIYATVATANTKAVSNTERDTERDTDSGLTTDSPLP